MKSDQQLSKEELSELIQFLNSPICLNQSGSELMNLMLLNEDLDMTN